MSDASESACAPEDGPGVRAATEAPGHQQQRPPSGSINNPTIGPTIGPNIGPVNGPAHRHVPAAATAVGQVEPAPASAFAAGTGRWSVWNADAVELHDLRWASAGVQVIRPGSHVVTRSGPALYLLLDHDELVDFDLGPVLQRLHWRSPMLIRLRVAEQREPPFERIVTPAGGQAGGLGHRRIIRHYRGRFPVHALGWITPDADVAGLWQASPSARAGSRHVRARAEKFRRDLISTPGRSWSLRREGEAGQFLSHLAHVWTRPEAVLPDVYEHDTGVWAHATATIDPQARFIAPVWIGRGAVVTADQTLVGPLILPDASPRPAGEQHRIPWREVMSSRWGLPNLVRGGLRRRAVKRVFDVAFSLFALSVTLPVYPVAAMLIWLEDGRPIFFAQKRQTLGGRSFPCLKFRTMIRDAEKLKAQLQARNQADGPQFFMDDDPRLLRVGRQLRRFQIDELPQFLNVLAGHMSVVGPRPSPDRENQYCPSWREARLSVRPGITGLWQVRRTREPLTDFQEWIRYDLDYVRHQSIARDVKIIVETVLRILRPRGRSEEPSSEETPGAGTS